MNPVRQPSIAIVIRALNEEQWLGPLLQAVRAQTCKNVEVIVVDSGSTDGTVAVAKQWADRLLEIETDSFSYGYALNVGLSRATADLVAIVSAHTFPVDSHWLDRMAAPFESEPSRSSIALTYGRQIGNHTTKRGEANDFSRQFPSESRLQKAPHYFCNNANSMVRRDLWEQHPFDHALPGLEDMAWVKHWMDRGLEVAYVGDAVIQHIHDENWQQIETRFRRETVAAGMIGLPLEAPAKLVARETGLGLRECAEAAARLNWRECVSAARYRIAKTRGSLLGRGHAPQSEPRPAEGLTTFRALEVMGANQASMVSRELPSLRPNEVLIQVSYVGICQTDLEVFRSTLGYYKEGRARLPIVPGHEYSGVVTMCGANVTGVKKGDRVVGECILSCGLCSECLTNRTTACRQRREVGVVNYHGACAEYLVLPGRFVHRVPDDLSLLSAATAEPVAVVLKGMRRAGLRSAHEGDRQRVLVVGAGAIGNLCSQIAHYWGHTVTVFDRLPERLAPLSSRGITTSSMLPEVNQFELVVEATGAVEIAEKLLQQARAGANLLFLGFPYGAVQWNIEQLVANDQHVVGSVGSDFESFESALRILPKLDLASFDSKILDLWDWDAAYALHESKQFLKIKLRVNPPSESITDTGQLRRDLAAVGDK